ncbi:DUF5063 domain-containing protein [Mangrovactinospora gilvigrisea]|uniref:DUF5063 domain-containing protein n=1 Tax=Mangrovactinospora gilvigrisea TaxID=1428644 RepID=A0A1J7BBP2_9ACTN|nr:DUF5063 domain-containing protein [Mangrovactinospora gilvigrisea]OIV36067.1 DUF5063 domain-containing protein [Mangrovactinospora gilvigrisea]
MESAALSEEAVDSFTVEIADQVESFLVAVDEIASGEAPDSAISMLLLEVSQLLLAGGRLGAIADVVPDERYEPDTDPDPDADELREKLGAMLAPIDVYTEVFDPYAPAAGSVTLRLSDDLAAVVTDLRHGLQHYRAGHAQEALWWWQFSYLSNWGSTAIAVLRALQSLVSHVRLDSPLGAVPDGQDTDSVADDDQLEQQAGDVMLEEFSDLVGDGEDAGEERHHPEKSA